MTDRPAYYATLPPPGEWVAEAACAQVDPELFFADLSRWNDTVTAKRICKQQCPVLQDCAEYAFSMGATLWGVWAGTTETERKQMRRQARGAA